MANIALENTVLEDIVQTPALFNRSHWGCIRLTGADRVRFLHNQTTNNIEQLATGQGCHTVFVTSTGRSIDLTTVYAFEDALLVVVSPGMSQQLYDWMDRYIFFSDKVTLKDEGEDTFLFTVLGADADSVMQQIGAAEAVGKSAFSHVSLSLPELGDITVAVGSELSVGGYTILGKKEQAAAVQNALVSAGAKAATTEQWEALRVQQGRPAAGQELTDDDNPLEAGLWHGISFEKGCYIGQETIARLNTYKGVKKRLWGLKLSEPVSVGATILVEDTKAGKVTSVVDADSGVFGLGYVRTKAGGEGLSVVVENGDGKTVTGEAIALPFVSHDYPLDSTEPTKNR